MAPPLSVSGVARPGDKLIPHFIDYPIIGRKALQYSIWIDIVNILTMEPKRTLERDNKINILINKLSDL